MSAGLVGLGYRTDLAVLRHGGTTVEDRGDHLVVRSPHNPTFWWGNFLVLRGVPDGPSAPEVWGERFQALFGEGRPIALGFDAARVEEESLEPWRAAGFAVHRDTVLTASEVRLPRPVSPSAELRPLASDADWDASTALRIACDEDGIPGFAAFAEASVAAVRRTCEAGASVWLGAFVCGRLVAQLGVVDCGDGLARYQTVETHPDFRRRGLAGGLLSAAAVEAGRRWPVSRFVIVADPDDHAIGLYLAAGFVPTEQQVGAQRPAG